MGAISKKNPAVQKLLKKIVQRKPGEKNLKQVTYYHYFPILLPTKNNNANPKVEKHFMSQKIAKTPTTPKYYSLYLKYVLLGHKTLAPKAHKPKLQSVKKVKSCSFVP